MHILDLTVRLALALVLLAAVAGKLRSAGSRREYTAMFPEMGVPGGLVRPLAVTLVAGEALTAVLLLVPRTATLGAAAAVLLFGALSAGVHRIVRSERRVRCNCFGGSSAAELSTVHLVRNLALTGLSLAALGLSLGGAAPGVPETAVAALAALVIAAVLVRFDDLVSLLR